MKKAHCHLQKSSVLQIKEDVIKESTSLQMMMALNQE